MRPLFWTAVLGIIACLPAQAQEAEFPDGTLIFLRNCNSIVERSTHGEIGHVAMLFHDGGPAWVYEATPGKVRRVVLEDYCLELSRLNRRRDDDKQIRTLALSPLSPYTPGETASMRAYLDAQLGRRYSVKNYVRGKLYDGIHCAELASTALARSGRYSFEEYHKINPQALYDSVLSAHWPPEPIELPPLVKESWSVRTKRRWTDSFAWCRWSCREAWLFLW